MLNRTIEKQHSRKKTFKQNLNDFWQLLELNAINENRTRTFKQNLNDFPDAKIAMTIPVSTWVSLDSKGKADEEEGFREMCFFLGQQHQDNPPKPTNERVYLKERPPMTIFTRLNNWKQRQRERYRETERHRERGRDSQQDREREKDR